MKLAIVTGSHRRESQSGKVGRYIEQVLKSEFLEVEDTTLVDLGQARFPLWDQDFAKDDEEVANAWSETSSALSAAHGFVVVVPEWNGQVPAALKNFFLLCTKHELAHKPALLVAVSAAVGGAYPIAELRMSSYKNTHICYIPEQIIVRSVRSMFNGPEPENEKEGRLAERTKYALAVLVKYAEALTPIRESGILKLDEYSFGM